MNFQTSHPSVINDDLEEYSKSPLPEIQDLSKKIREYFYLEYTIWLYVLMIVMAVSLPSGFTTFGTFARRVYLGFATSTIFYSLLMIIAIHRRSLMLTKIALVIMVTFALLLALLIVYLIHLSQNYPPGENSGLASLLIFVLAILLWLALGIHVAVNIFCCLMVSKALKQKEAALKFRIQYC